MSDRTAALYLLGMVDLRGAGGCDGCGEWAPSFTPSAGADHDLLASTGCPYHPDGREWTLLPVPDCDS
ncbi:hypothetical protein [Prescottella equi]|uniref:hypothetical protein n=1 Tax=Rhodococcus hoagii TaxID=43767 RepID=UPI000A1133FA|nr:hypothetical protein [Prescottella equi]ORL76410.1 hypothetical protein A5N71_16355 [Prescottella equi]